MELVRNDRRWYLNSLYKNALRKWRADPNNAYDVFAETNLRINKQLQQHRKKLFGWQGKWGEIRYTTKMPVHHQRQQKIIGNKIGWEIDSNQEYVRADCKRVRSRLLQLYCAYCRIFTRYLLSGSLYIGFLYIGLLHDKFIKNMFIDIDKLHNKASAFGNVIKLKTYPSKPPYECAFIVFESRAMAEKARTGLSLEFNELFIQHVAWANPPDCAADEKFDFYAGIGYVLRLRPLSSSQIQLLLSGFMRRFNGNMFMPSDVFQLCISYFSEWKDLKISFVDDVTGNIDTTKYQIKPIFSNRSIIRIAKEIENEMYRKIVSNEYKLWLGTCLQSSWDSKEQRNEFIKDKMIKKFVKFEPEIDWNKPKFDEIRWCGYKERGRGETNPLVHVWLKFKHMKKIYSETDEYWRHESDVVLNEGMFANEDKDRWVEVPRRSTDLKINEIDSFDIATDCLVIERCYVSENDWYCENWNVICKWPREKGDDWRETLQVGDIVEVYYSGYCGWYYEQVVAYIYPNDHETMSGKCVVKDGMQYKVLDINSRDIIKRYTDKRQRKRKERGECDEHVCEINDEYDEPAPVAPSVKDSEVMSSHASAHKAYKIEKYSKNHKAKKIYPQKKRLKRKMRKYGVKSGDKRIENKMKKYKNRYECLEY